MTGRIARRLAALLLITAALTGAALGEDSLQWQGWDGEAWSIRHHLDIDDEGFSALLEEAVEAALKEAPVEDCQPSRTVLSIQLGQEEYRIARDLGDSRTLDPCLLIHGDAVHPFDRTVGAMLDRLTGLRVDKGTEISFIIPEEVRGVFSRSGFTPAYRIAGLEIQLPEKIECRPTSGVGTYFSFVDLLLQDGGWDLGKHAGQRITAEIYGVLERHSSADFMPEDREQAAWYDLRAVVLKRGAAIIGAYLPSCQNGDWMYSATGRTSCELLGERTVEDWLRAHYTMTAADRKAAQMTPEQVIRAWAKAPTRGKANVYEPLSHWLGYSTWELRDDQLFRKMAEVAYSPAAAGLGRIRQDTDYNGYNDACYDIGSTSVFVNDYGPGIGWKVEGAGGY